MTLSSQIMQDRPWWPTERDPDRDPKDDLWARIERLKRNSATLFHNSRKLMAIYQWGARASEQWEYSTAPLDQSTHYNNVAKNIIDTVHAKVCKTETRPMPMTEGKGYLAERRARDLGRAIEGVFDDNDFEAIKEDVVLDAQTSDHGAGATITFRDAGRIVIEHVPIEDVFVDDTEARYRKPRSMYRRMLMDRYVALEKFGGDAEGLFGDADEREHALSGAPATSELADDARTIPFKDTDQIEIWEAWHLRSRPANGDDEGSADGWHAVICKGQTLVLEPWKRDRFPITLYVPMRRRRHIWGISLMRGLVAGQTEHEKVSEKIQTGFQKTGVAQFAIPKGSNVDARELSNKSGVSFEYEGTTPPTPFNVDPIPASLVQHKSDVSQSMSQFNGVSDFSTSSQLPRGMANASGKALQLVDDVESERLLPYYKPLQRFVIAIMWSIIDEVEDALEEAHETDDDGNEVESRTPKLTARNRSRGGLEVLDWAKLVGERIARESGGASYKRDYDFQLFPVSNLARTPGAKFEQLTDMLNAGAITVAQFKRQMDLGADIDSELEMDSADIDVIAAALDAMVIEGKYSSPEPTMNFALAKDYARRYANRCIAKGGIPDVRLDLVRQWIGDIDAEEARVAERKAAIQAAQQGGAAPLPGGPPMPPMPPMPPGPMGPGPGLPLAVGGLPPGAMPPPMAM